MLDGLGHKGLNPWMREVQKGGACQIGLKKWARVRLRQPGRMATGINHSESQTAA